MTTKTIQVPTFEEIRRGLVRSLPVQLQEASRGDNLGGLLDAVAASQHEMWEQIQQVMEQFMDQCLEPDAKVKIKIQRKGAFWRP